MIPEAPNSGNAHPNWGYFRIEFWKSTANFRNRLKSVRIAENVSWSHFGFMVQVQMAQVP